ncbi:lycopene cyclase family protein [Amycolatopsis sp. TRM77291]
MTGVVVIGAGVAGAICAEEIARGGRPVTLIGSPTAGSTYDLLLPAGFPVRGVGERDVASYLVRFGKESSVRWQTPGLSICDRHVMESALVARAVDAGARYVPATVDAIEPAEDRWRLAVSLGGGRQDLEADALVLATGAGAGPYSAKAGGIACAQAFTGIDDDQVTLHLAAPDHHDAHSAPWSIRVLPSGDGTTVTISVTTLAANPPANLIERAVEELVAADGRYSRLEPIGDLKVSAVNGAFDPEAAIESPGLRIGSAAGLVNPFTGEGISYAVRSARLASQALAGGEGAAARYSRSLSRTFVGQLGTAEHAARRYHLAWRMLAHTATQDNPFFAQGRRAVLLPGGFGQLTPPLPIRAERAEPFMLACAEVLMVSVRPHWPFLASLAAGRDDHDQQTLRPAALFVAAVLACGARPKVAWAPVSAAIELVGLGMLALTATKSTIAAESTGMDWSSATAILAGDFLLSKGAQLIARNAPDLSGPFAAWMNELVELRAREVAEPGCWAASFFGALFEFPARIGAGLAGANSEETARLREIGYECGIAFVYTEDTLALNGEQTRLDTTLDGLRAARLSTVPPLVDGVAQEGFRDSCRQEATAAYGRAMVLLREVGTGVTRAFFEEIVSEIAGPVLRKGRKE